MIICNSNLQSYIMYALSDSQMHRILQSTSISDKPATEIIREQELPYSTAYKKIAELVKWGLLVSYRSEIIDKIE
jgi:predicted transcriptional regulator